MAGKWLAVGDGGTLLTSEDGIAWTAGTSGVTAMLRGAAVADGLHLIVAVGDSGTIITAENDPAGTWVAQSSGVTQRLYEVCWSEDLGLLVAVGLNGTVLTSPDGVTWTARTAGTGNFFSVTWSPSLALFVAVGSAATCYTSPDGVTWTSRSMSFDQFGLVWSPGLGKFVTTASNGSGFTSTNGTSWSSYSSPASLRKVDWSPSLARFVSVGSSGAIYASAAGTSWTQRTSGTTSTLVGVGWSGDLAQWVAVGDAGTILSSPDDVTWTQRTSGTSSILTYAMWVPQLNAPPNAPTLTNPVGGAVIDRTAAQRFSWDFNDPDAGDSQSQYELRYRVVGAATWTTVGPNASTNAFHDFAASTFADGDYEWQARTWDAQGEVGPWSASEFFTAATPPDPPSITDPISGQTIPTETYVVEWSAPSQAAYQLRRVADNAGSPDTATVYFDTGTVESSTSRSRSVDFPTNNRWEHVQVRIRNNGLWSEWASVRVEVAYTPPASPSGSTATHSSGAAVDVSGTNPAPVGDEPDVTEMRLWVRSDDDPHRPPEGIRIAVGEPTDPTYPDWAVASRVDYEWRWQAIGDNGTSSYSEWFA